MPLTVTEQAARALKHMLDNVDHEPDQVIRLMSGPKGSLTLALDTEKEEDQVVEYKGDKVLVIEPPVSEHLSASTLDNVGTPEQPDLRLTQ